MGEFIPNPLAAEEIKHDPITQLRLREIADEGSKVAQDHAAVETGEMRDSIHVEQGPEGPRIVVGTDHWVYVEFGTSVMAAQPFMRPLVEQLGLHR